LSRERRWLEEGTADIVDRLMACKGRLLRGCMEGLLMGCKGRSCRGYQEAYMHWGAEHLDP
jgi:hypothetical protein